MRFVQQETYFVPVITNTPDLPSIDWKLIGQEAPVLLYTPPNELPPADVVIMTWSFSEWASFQQVFCNSEGTTPYSAQNNTSWPGWEQYSQDLLPYNDPSDPWTFWCWTRLVQIQGQNVLLIKSNTHLGWPGPMYLEAFIYLVIKHCQPKLILSEGTAGGAQVYDHTGTTYVVNAGTLYDASKPQSEWYTYGNAWQANWSVMDNPCFNQLLFPVPTTEYDLLSCAVQFNQYYGTCYTLAQLNPGNLDMGDPVPVLENLTPKDMPLLTTSVFILGNNEGSMEDFACVEMDDALVGKICNLEGVPFGFIRNLSDPVGNALLPTTVQSNWGSALYGAYGFYTNFNGALAAWAVASAQLAEARALEEQVTLS